MERGSKQLHLLTTSLSTQFFMLNYFSSNFAQTPKIILVALTMSSLIRFLSSSSSPAAASKADLESKSYRELQSLCREANLSVKGTTEVLRKRLLSESARVKKTKRLPPKAEKGDKIKAPPKKKSKPSPADDLICPITTELPLEPVVAEDGRTYE